MDYIVNIWYCDRHSTCGYQTIEKHGYLHGIWCTPSCLLVIWKFKVAGIIKQETCLMEMAYVIVNLLRFRIIFHQLRPVTNALLVVFFMFRLNLQLVTFWWLAISHAGCNDHHWLTCTVPHVHGLIGIKQVRLMIAVSAFFTVLNKSLILEKRGLTFEN